MTIVRCERLRVKTHGKGFTNITRQVQQVVAEADLAEGLCTVFLQHTSASLVIQENADPAVLRDLESFMSELVSERRAWEHADEGPDDMPAHVRTALTRSSESIPVVGGRLGLGTWQGIYLWEHRAFPHTRSVLVQLLGSAGSA